MSVLEAQARIAEIRTMLGTTRPSPTTVTPSFADALQSSSSALSAVSTTGTASGGLSATSAAAAGGGAAVVRAAEKYVGTPYSYGSNKPENGLDCSGLVQRAYADVGVKLPRTAAEQAKAGQPVASLDDARPGDLLAFNRPVDHIAIYAGAGRMIVAPHTGANVRTEPVPSTPSAIRRIVPSAVPAAASATSSGAVIRPAALTTATPASVPYAELFQSAGARYGLSPLLLAAVAKVESGYNPNAVSRAGAQGLMQLMPATARGLGVNALNPSEAVDGAARMLSANLKRFGTVDLALAAYNAGGGAVSRYGGIPPFPQTQAYVPKVKAAMEQLTRTLESAFVPPPAAVTAAPVVPSPAAAALSVATSPSAVSALTATLSGVDGTTGADATMGTDGTTGADAARLATLGDPAAASSLAALGDSTAASSLAALGDPTAASSLAALGDSTAASSLAALGDPTAASSLAALGASDALDASADGSTPADSPDLHDGLLGGEPAESGTAASPALSAALAGAGLADGGAA